MAVINPKNVLCLPAKALTHHLWVFTTRQLERTLLLLLALPWHQGLLLLWQKGRGTEKYDHSAAVMAHSSVNQVEVPLISVFDSKLSGEMQQVGSKHAVRLASDFGRGQGWSLEMGQDGKPCTRAPLVATLWLTRACLKFSQQHH